MTACAINIRICFDCDLACKLLWNHQGSGADGSERQYNYIAVRGIRGAVLLRRHRNIHNDNPRLSAGGFFYLVDCEPFGVADVVFVIAYNAQLPALMATLRVGLHESVYFVLHLLLADRGSLVLNKNVPILIDHVGIRSVGFADVWLNLKGDWFTKLKIDVRESQEMLQL